MLNISQKKEVVKRLSQQFSEAEILVSVDYMGLDVAAITDLRAKLRQVDGKMEVVKNTLLRLAVKDTEAALLTESFTGPTAVVSSAGDVVALAKVLTDFAKDHEKLEISAAVMAGKMLDTKQIEQLSKMPSREELLTKLVCVLNGVPTSLVNVLSGVPRSLVNVLSSIKDQKDAA